MDDFFFDGPDQWNLGVTRQAVGDNLGAATAGCKINYIFFAQKGRLKKLLEQVSVTDEQIRRYADSETNIDETVWSKVKPRINAAMAALRDVEGFRSLKLSWEEEKFFALPYPWRVDLAISREALDCAVTIEVFAVTEKRKVYLFGEKIPDDIMIDMTAKEKNVNRYLWLVKGLAAEAREKSFMIEADMQKYGYVDGDGGRT